MDSSTLLIIIGAALLGLLSGWLIAGYFLSKKTDALVHMQSRLEQTTATLEADKKNLSGLLQESREHHQALHQQLTAKETLEKDLSIRNKVLEEQLSGQKKELEELHQRFNETFENLANRIFKEKTQSFAVFNQEQLKPLLEPLSKNLSEFKAKVEEVYVKEAKERFSLSERVKELAALNQKISDEANNLTKALKGEAHTQGRWGEMILESILEKSGLHEGMEYFIQHQLTDEDGKALRSEHSQKRMRPDAVVKYPGGRSIIIDAKVSLNAYSRFVAATDDAERKQSLDSHIAAIKKHIMELSARGYDDYASSLDFVMMFLPSESAYMAAIQGDAGLWDYAYDKRILLLSPANLITALKLVVDLWKREYQDLNARKIAEQGGKLYDKLVNFVESLNNVGVLLNKARDQFDIAQKRLSDGQGNLISQAEKLKAMGVTTKKELK